MAEDERLPVIWEKGVKTFGDEEMMRTMIQNFEPMSFDGVMKELSIAIQGENWPEVKRNAHTMKGSSSYIGADRFSEVCLLLQNAAMGQNVEEIYDSYEKVLKEGKMLKNYLAKLLEKVPDTTEIDKYISDWEKLKKSKKPNKDAGKAPKNASESKDIKKNNSGNNKNKIEENKEANESLKKEKNGAPNSARGILEGGEASADKACCKQCCIF